MQILDNCIEKDILQYRSILQPITKVIHRQVVLNSFISEFQRNFVTKRLDRCVNLLVWCVHSYSFKEQAHQSELSTPNSRYELTLQFEKLLRVPITVCWCISIGPAVQQNCNDLALTNRFVSVSNEKRGNIGMVMRSFNM